MPKISAAGGVKLYYEEAGQGTPLLFIHEFAGDHRSWETQMRFFSRRYRAITYSARGYPPSDVPEELEAYSQEAHVEDALAILDGLKIEKAHICGLSMGSYTSLLFGLKYPERAISLIVAGSGYGSGKERGDWYTFLDKYADSFLQEGMNDMTAAHYASGHTRVQLQNKDPRGFEEYQQQFFQHSPLGSANTFRGVQKNRPNLLDLEEQLRKLTIPTLLMLGDEEARSLGVRVRLVRPLILATAALVTGTAVAFSGTITFVGLVVPHMLRLLFGPDHRVLIPLSAAGGALFVVVADTIARTALQPTELRVGIITALVGAPFFLFLLIRNKRQAEAF